VAGRIITLPVADNQFVRKGDALFEIDPADYRITLEQAQAQVQRDGAVLDYARKNEDRKASLAKEGRTSTDIYQQTTSTPHQSEGVVALD
jgi:multidrug resistance efflux pump